ncbi:copper type II ascorbate-dependent monooxygenase-like protein [Micromonospora pisi]|uniref:Copper type II ascorbate-dependent monooxygenase-like protein n=1 Tax=Micromonospora pisi TaxID=589240 RepID=A0A495JCB3_9ACTN|nr:monooxygenase [Micromonospora pisi]RKR86148.1 copper type II ascorbate-dependent monooxygenase-like protein [Micromonospora pisi]
MEFVRPVQRSLRAAAALGAVALLVTACALGPAGDPSGGGTPTPSGAGHGGHDSSFDPPVPAPLRDGERFVNLTMPQPYTPAAPNGGTDEYRCFLVDPGLTNPAYLTGSQFLPQNVDLVHHAIFFRIAPAEATAARALDDRTPGEGWTCFGNSGIGRDAAWIAHWAPGANETLLAPNLGYQMTPGSQLVMQVHYNLLGAPPGAVGSDRSGIRLRLTDGGADFVPLHTTLLPAPVELPCTAEESGPLCDRTAAVADVAHRFGAEAEEAVGELNQYCNGGRAPTAGTTQHCDHQVTEKSTLYALAGHMHLLGRSIKVELNPGTTKARTLLDIPAYDFDAQAMHPLSAPVTVEPGDSYRVTCTHDAGLRRQLPALQPLPPRYVVWGEGTSDEMCLGLIVQSHPA